MATIKELAKDYATVKDGKETYVNSIKRKSFEAGANAVLEEIKNTIEKYSKVNPIFPLSVEEVQLKKVKTKIKELKGK